MDKIILSSVDISALRKEIGQSDKKIISAATEYTTTPESGTFKNVGSKEFDIPGVGKVTSLGIYTENGEFVSENSLNLQDLKNSLVEIKTGNRKGKFMLKSERLTDLRKFGTSSDKILETLQGKSFSTTPEDARVYKSEFLDVVKFDDVCQTTNSDTSLNKALRCTELKKGYTFKID